MAEFEITERTEPLTLDEVFSFIDETNISKRDAHELKSRIADVVNGIRENAIDEFAEVLKEKNKTLIIGNRMIDEVAEKLKGVQNEKT